MRIQADSSVFQICSMVALEKIWEHVIDDDELIAVDEEHVLIEIP